MITIGISLGDVTGIGPEVTLKAVATELKAKDAGFLIIGDSRQLRGLNQKLGLNLPLRDYGGGVSPGEVAICETLPKAVPEKLEKGAPEAALAAVNWLQEGARRCLKGEISAMVTAPVNKESIVRAGQKFIGQTEFLSELAQASRTAM